MRISTAIISAMAAVVAADDYTPCTDNLAPPTQFYIYGNEKCSNPHTDNVKVCMYDLAEHNYGEPEGCHKLPEGVKSISQWTTFGDCNLWLYTDEGCVSGIKHHATYAGCDAPDGDYTGAGWKAYRAWCPPN